MKSLLLTITLGMGILTTTAQSIMTPELLWKVGRVSAVGISEDGKVLVYKVSTPSVKENKIHSKFYSIPVSGGTPTEIDSPDSLIKSHTLSPDGKWKAYHEEVKIQKIHGKDYYPELELSNAQIYDALDYRHWDKWNEGMFNHVFYKRNEEGATGIDIMANEPYYSPQKPFGGDDDYIWSPDSKKIIYVSKKKSGTDYAVSTNTDLYEYSLETGQTKNLTENNPGYDTHPVFSPDGYLTWLQMKRDGYEADKNDIIVRFKGSDINLTRHWDETVNGFKWSPDGKKIYFTAATNGTVHLFEVNFPGLTKIIPKVKQITKGDFDITGIIGFSGDRILLTRQDFNRATEIYSYDLKKGTWQALTTVNDGLYKNITKSKTERRWVTTTDGKEMLVWVIYPPDFDPEKKYPALLYCQGGPQGALTQFYSFRWNFQVMAAQGYIVVAPNRRGMPGHGVEWNEQISKDWGGQVMDDYLSAIDDIAKEKFTDTSRLGAVGASYGGYSVFYLAGIHNKRFKTFISHCGVFNLQSMYGTTEEVFFTNWDIGGPYWDKNNAAAQKSYSKYNPVNNVQNWDTPILVIQGGKDYRVPIGQGQEAFQAAQLRGIKSRFLYFEEENHWVLLPQNGLVWQQEFFRWLKETL